ncbi:MAG: DUF1905 domain-containing protein [Acidobacteriia bacterium]|nr:DUF1905 domain-containing protein [Terriglobia bacterium]
MSEARAPKSSVRSFQAILERGAGSLNWTIARIPFDVSKVWGARGHLRVKGEINGFVFSTSLFPDGSGRHVLLVNKVMQKGAKASLGTTARFRIEPDTVEPAISMPPELERALSEVRALHRWFDRLSFSNRNYISKWVAAVKSSDARERRAMQIAERLLATMEAEKELPPLIRTALARDPRAAEGWKLMSAARRRGHLLGIFYYRDPLSQSRRVGRAVKDAYEIAEKQRPKT